MNTKSLAEIRLELRKRCKSTAGADGEAFAEKWLKQSKWKYEAVEQSKNSLSEDLRQYGGKRPDFLTTTEDELCIVALDAKYHTTQNGKTFSLTDDELAKYKNLKRFIEDKQPGKTAEVLFMVVPKEFSGKKLVWMALFEFEDGVAAKLAGDAATQVSLEDRGDLWCEIEA